MKKVWFAFFSILSSIAVFAQEPADALRFSWVVPGGTARQQAIGGAMGSLGGDVSATFTNPAGLALYKTGDFVITPRYLMNTNKATYLDRTEKESITKMALGTTGFVAGAGRNGRGRNVAFSMAYNRAADFNSTILYRGSNNQNSYSQRYLEELTNAGVRDSSAAFAFPFGSSLALNTYWIDPVKNSDGQVTGFTTNSPIGTGLLQQNQVENRGGIDEFALGVGVSVSDKVMLGGTFSVPVLRYERVSSFTEADATDDVTNHFNFATIDENVSTKGVGINARLGLIFKPVDYLRLGLAFHSPTLYTLKDMYDVAITTDAEGPQGVLTDYSTDYTNDQPSSFSYTLATPFKAIASASYVLREIADITQQKGFLTADIEYVDYRTNSFKADDVNTIAETDKEYLESLNKAIDNAYKSAFNVKVGGELKFTTLMVRAGVAYFGNPYKNINDERGRKLNLSGGLGYRNKGMFVDLTYVHSLINDVHFAYRLQNTPYKGAQIKSGIGTVLATVGLKF